MAFRTDLGAGTLGRDLRAPLAFHRSPWIQDFVGGFLLKEK